MAPTRDLSALIMRGTATGKRWSAGKAGMSGNKACGLSTLQTRSDGHLRRQSTAIEGILWTPKVLDFLMVGEGIEP